MYLLIVSSAKYSLIYFQYIIWQFPNKINKSSSSFWKKRTTILKKYLKLDSWYYQPDNRRVLKNNEINLAQRYTTNWVAIFLMNHPV